MPENEAYGMTNPAAWAPSPAGAPTPLPAPTAPAPTAQAGAGVLPPGYGNDPQALMQMIMQTILGQNLARFFGGNFGNLAPSQFTPGMTSDPNAKLGVQGVPGGGPEMLSQPSLPNPTNLGMPVTASIGGPMQPGFTPGPIGGVMGANPAEFGGSMPGMEAIVQLLSQLLGGQQAPQNQAPQGMNNAPYSWLSQFGQGMGQ